MREGSVILANIPQEDGSFKRRPAIVLREMPRFHDLLVCGVSSQLHQEIEGFDEIISPSDADYAASSLAAVSVIRLGYLFLVPKKDVEGTIGSISQKRYKRLLRNLTNYLLKKTK